MKRKNIQKEKITKKQSKQKRTSCFNVPDLQISDKESKRLKVRLQGPATKAKT